MEYESREVIHRSIRFIESRLVDDINVSELAEQALFSRTHYQRLFRAMIGETVMEYVKKRRLQQAEWYLRETDDSVLDIALKFGYSSHEGFTRAFKSHFGVPPARYRKQYSLPGLCPILKEEIGMLSKELIQRITSEMNKLSEVLVPYQNEIKELAALIDKTAGKAGDAGKTALVAGAEIHSLAGRTADMIKFIKSELCANENSVYEITDKVYLLMRQLDDNAYQAYLLRYLSGVEMVRAGEPKDKFAEINQAFDRLINNQQANQEIITKLLGELNALIKSEIKKEASTVIESALATVKQTENEGIAIFEEAKALALTLGAQGNAYMSIANDIQTQVGAVRNTFSALDDYAKAIENDTFADRKPVDSAIAKLNFAAFHMNLNAFNAAIETARFEEIKTSKVAGQIMKYAGKLHGTISACIEGFNECVKLLNINASGKIPETFAEKFQKSIDDVLFQATMFGIQLEIEAERADLEGFKEIARKIGGIMAELREFGRGGDLMNAVNALERYYESLVKLTEECRREAEKNKEKGAPIEFITRGYRHLADRIKIVLEVSKTQIV